MVNQRKLDWFALRNCINAVDAVGADAPVYQHELTLALGYSNKDSRNTQHSTLNTQRGILPCFLLGMVSTLFSSILYAFISLVRVSSGRITSSMKPRAAAR